MTTRFKSETVLTIVAQQKTMHTRFVIGPIYRAQASVFIRYD
jgi:hypothetical protein